MHANGRQTQLGFSVLILIMLLLTCCCCEPIRVYQYSPDDVELLPYAGMYRVDRERYCLTEIDPDSEVAIVDASYAGEEYDVVIYMRSKWTTRSIAFARENGGYVWIGEAETHYSGRTYVNFEGTEERERIFIQYNEREFDYWGPVGLMILSYGVENKGIAIHLTCEEALSIIREWEAERTTSEDN